MIKKISATALFYFFWLTVFGQISKVEPEKPSTGDVINLTYNCSASGARLDGKEPVYARITKYLQDGSVQKMNLNLTGNSDTVSHQMKLPENTASFKVEFYTLDKEDDSARQILLVYDNNHYLPVKSAYLEAMFDSKPDSIFQKEIKNYPDNYLAYARFMNVVSMVKDEQTAKLQIENLLKRINSITLSDSNKTQLPGLLVALCVGNAKTGSLDIGKRYLFEILNRFPLANESAFAFSVYNYEYYKSCGKDVEEDLRAKLKEIFLSYPHAAVSKNPNVLHLLQNEKNVPLQAFEKVLLPLYKTDQIEYYAFTNLPEIYIEHGVKPDSAELLLNQGLKRFNNGTINHQYRLNYGQYQLYVPLLYLALVKLNVQRRNYQSAITNSSAALNILVGSNTEGNFRPLLLMLRASAFRGSGNLNLALEDYKQLYKTGDAAALDSIQLIFPLCNLKQKTFSEFVNTLKARSYGKSDPTPSLDFTATDLNGNRIRLSDLKGKLVVMNIWGIGCGPCITEMPHLNQLVKQNARKPEVVFIAVTADKTQALIKFLKNHQFDYRILNNAGSMEEIFETNALPVHIVFGKNGEIINKSIGARPNIQQYLQQIINNHL